MSQTTTTMTQKKEPLEIDCVACGSRFRLWLPLAIIHETAKQGLTLSCVLCGAKYQAKKTTDGFSIVAIKEAGEGSTPSAALSDVAAKIKAPVPITDRILMIEDDMIARAMVESQLFDSGIEVVMAKNSSEALRAIKKQKFSLIVSDLHLKNQADPESQLDGEELIKRIIDSGVELPAIITTGKDILDDMIADHKWFDLHVKGFIQKGNPFWVEELKLKVKEVLYKD
ncbi:MAG: response regulator [Deltaproteobacteria bacterium]|nr:response regulator [Deltaproteobacteria bacterium]